MKNFDSRTYNVHDFLEWEQRGQLQLNPAFQRRAVWSDKAKSYLMDTILRGKPIPKIFIRQQINITTKESIREIVDGQQRLRTILSFIKDGFEVNRTHNSEFGGLKFSELPAETQEQILTFELAVDLLVNMPDREVLDVFSRLNSYAVILNEQEKINANHFSRFKALADKIGHKYYDYWKSQGIVTPRNILRMQEVNLVADLLIAMREGIKSKKRIKSFYDSYEKRYDDDTDAVERDFDATISIISELYPEGLSTTEFSRVHLFYSLFTATYHCLFGLPRFDVPRIDLRNDTNLQVARNALDHVGEIFEAAADIAKLPEDERQFIQDSRRATTDEVVRGRRTKFLLALMA